MKVIGITGGIGAGKTIVLNYIKENYNAKILIADEIAHNLMEPGKECYERIVKAFPNCTDDEDKIDRKKLSDIIFQDGMNRLLVNEIVHPAVKEHILSVIEIEKKKGNAEYVIVEAALLLEDNYPEFLDEVWYIYASEKTRRNRLKESRGLSDKKITEIIQSQLKEREFREKCDVVISNDGNLHATQRQIAKALEGTSGEMEMAAEAENNQQYVFGLDIGTRNVVGTVGYMEDDKFNVVAMSVKEHDTRAMLDGQIHDITKVGKTVAIVKAALEEKIGQPLTEVCIAAAGRVLKTVTISVDMEFEEETVVTSEHIHSLDLLGIEKAQGQLVENNDTKFRFYCVGYTVIKYYLNDDTISNLEGHKAKKITEDIIVTFLPEDVVDGLYSAVGRAGLSVLNLTLEPIAAINVAIPEAFRMLNLALVDVGAGTSDICITRDGSIIAYGMIPYAGDEITELLVQHYLVDFNTAEKIKIGASGNEPIKYNDIMCIPHEITPEEVWEVTSGVVSKIAEDVSEKILELNGASPVSAVFVVGGGGKIHGFTEKIATELELIKERVALRGEEVLGNVVFQEESIKKDPLIVTPVGICLNYYDQKNSFIFVHFNGERIKLYNNSRLTIVDAAVEAEFPNESLFPKRGKELTFYVGDKQRIVRGGLGEAAIIKVNGREVSLNTPIDNNNIIEIIPSTEGEAAVCRIEDLPEYKSTIDFFVNGQAVTCPRFAEVDGKLQPPTYEIQDGDCVEMRNYYTVEQIVQFMDVQVDFSSVIYVNNQSVDPNEKVYENFTVDIMILENGYETKAEVPEKDGFDTANEAAGQGGNDNNATEGQASVNSQDENENGQNTTAENSNVYGNSDGNANMAGNQNGDFDNGQNMSGNITAGAQSEFGGNNETFTGNNNSGNVNNSATETQSAPSGINVYINDRSYHMTGKSEFTFVDIFDYIEFDLTAKRGMSVVTQINGENCGYTDPLKEGDRVSVEWKTL